MRAATFERHPKHALYCTLRSPSRTVWSRAARTDMKETTKLIVSIAALGIALAGLILTTTSSLREDIREIRRDVQSVRHDVQMLSDRVSRLEGLMQGVLAGRSATAAIAQVPETVRQTAPTATE